MTSDTELLSALRAGQAEALAPLFETFADRLYGLALGLLRDPSAAEDVVQETFLKALTHAAQFEGRARLETWLYRVAYNASLDRLRRRPTEPLPDEAPGDDEAGPPLPANLADWRATPEAAVLDAEAHAALQAAIGRLPEGLRAVFILRDIDGLSGEAAAEALGLSVGAVKVRLHRARLSLREQLAAYFGQPAGAGS